MAVHISHPRYGSPDHDSIAPIRREESEFRHSGWATDRRRVYESLGRCHEPQRRVDAFANCGSALVAGECEGDPILLCNHCRDRLCQPCQVARRARLVEAILVAISGAEDRVRFLTFTLKHRDVPLCDQLDRLYHSFRILRRRPLWRNSMTGGAMFLEVKVGKDGLYHPHLHVLVEGTRIDQRDLSADWYAVTGDSFVVDMRACPNPLKRAQYVTKYATKPADSSIIRVPDKLDEFVIAIKGRRLFQPFGTWRALLPKEDSDEPVRAHRVIDSIDVVFSRAAAGCHECRGWISKALLKWPALSVFAPHPTHTDTDPCPP